MASCTVCKMVSAIEMCIRDRPFPLQTALQRHGCSPSGGWQRRTAHRPPRSEAQSQGLLFRPLRPCPASGSPSERQSCRTPRWPRRSCNSTVLRDVYKREALQARRMRRRRPEGTLIAFCELVIKTLLDINRPLLSFLHSIERMPPVSVVCRRGCFFQCLAGWAAAS